MVHVEQGREHNTYWGIDGTDPEQYKRALDAGRVEQDIPVNHSTFFAPVVEPTLSNGTRALVVAALTYLARQGDPGAIAINM